MSGTPAAALVMKRLVRAVLLSGVVWVAGFVAGSLVYLVPHLRHLHPIPGVTLNVAVSLVVPVVWVPLLVVLSRRFVRAGPSAVGDGVLLGLWMAGTNLVLDRVVLVGWFEAGPSFHSYAAIWFAYLLVVLVPVVVALGRRFEPEGSGAGG